MWTNQEEVDIYNILVYDLRGKEENGKKYNKKLAYGKEPFKTFFIGHFFLCFQ